MVCDEVDRLDRLVDNLLSLSRIEAGAFHPDRQAVDLEELVARPAPAPGAALRRPARCAPGCPADLPLVDADYAQVERVAHQPARQRGPPRARRHRRVGHRPSRRRRWSGSRCPIGARACPTRRRERIFEPFQRGEGSRSSGIGLAICKAIVTAHGGEIAVERTFGGGATFAFTLPVHAGAAPA